MTPAERIRSIQIARMNATCALDQNDIDGYYINMLDTLEDLRLPFDAAIDEFNRLTGNKE